MLWLFWYFFGYVDCVGYFVFGNGIGVVCIVGVLVGVVICWEVIFDCVLWKLILGGV